MQSLEFLRAWRERARKWQEQVPAPDTLPEPPAMEGAFMDGNPLVTLVTPKVPAGLYGKVLADLADLLPEHRPEDEGPRTLAHAVRKADEAAMQVLVDALLAGDGTAVQRWAGDHGVASDLLTTLAGLALQPFMTRFASSVIPGAPLPMWRRNYCPVCGVAADVCRIDPDNLRWLHCPQCDTQWEHYRLTCVNCDTDDVKKVHILTLQDLEPWRVEVCDVCGGYTKTLDQRHGGHLALPKVDLFLEDARTLQLDLIAEQEGYRKGGRVQ